MFELSLWIGVLVISLYGLIKASGYFTSAAEKIGLMCGLSQFVVGATIVSIGTSLPELISCTISVFKDASEIVAGNVIGSNVANIMFILGIGAIVGRRLNLQINLIDVNLPLLLGSAFFLVMTCQDGVFSRGEAGLAVFSAIIFIIYTLKGDRQDTQSSSEKKLRPPFKLKPFIVLLSSSLFIYLGAAYTVEAVVKLSALLNVGKELVAVSAVALGTSLPELAVTLNAVKKEQAELIVGNVLGSNMFNTFAVMGIPGLIKSLEIPESMIHIGLPISLIAAVLFFTVTQDRRITCWEGWMFVVFYAFFIGKLFHFL